MYVLHTTGTMIEYEMLHICPQNDINILCCSMRYRMFGLKINSYFTSTGENVWKMQEPCWSFNLCCNSTSCSRWTELNVILNICKQIVQRGFMRFGICTFNNCVWIYKWWKVLDDFMKWTALKMSDPNWSNKEKDQKRKIKERKKRVDKDIFIKRFHHQKIYLLQGITKKTGTSWIRYLRGIPIIPGLLEVYFLTFQQKTDENYVPVCMTWLIFFRPTLWIRCC